MKVSAIITLKKDVLDPQGKVFEIDVKENDPSKAKVIVEDMCKKLLANLVIENYKIIETQ